MLNWQCCLASSSKTAPRILISSMAMGADYSFQLISIETFAPQYKRLDKLFLGSAVCSISSLMEFFLIVGHSQQDFLPTFSILQENYLLYLVNMYIQLTTVCQNLTFKVKNHRNLSMFFLLRTFSKSMYYTSKASIHFLKSNPCLESYPIFDQL